MYEVKFKNKNKSVMVQKGESILSKSNDEGLDIPFACLQGMCTTCIATVLEGKTSYIEEPDPDSLTEEDIKNNKLLLCVATPESDLLIYEIEE